MQFKNILIALLTTGAIASSAMAGPAKVMIPAAAGGGWDGTGRAIFDSFQKSGILTEGATITNKGGAAGTIGLVDFLKDQGNDDAVMITGMVMVGGIVINKSPVNLDKVTPLARLTTEFEVIAVPANSPIKNIKELVEALKKDPGKTAIGGGSAGGTDHILLGLIAKESGVATDKINYVPFAGGGEAMPALAGGKVTAAISGIGEFKPHADAGLIRILAVSSDARLPIAKDIPTLKENGINVVLGNWRGIVGAPGMSDAGKKIWIDRLTKLDHAKEWKEALAKNGWEDAFLVGDAFASFIKTETTRISGILSDLGLGK